MRRKCTTDALLQSRAQCTTLITIRCFIYKLCLGLGLENQLQLGTLTSCSSVRIEFPL